MLSVGHAASNTRLNLLEPSQLLEILRRLQMRSIVAEAVEVFVDLPAMAEYVALHTSSLPTAAAFSALSSEVQRETATLIAEDLHQYEQADGTFSVPFTSHLVSATK